MLAFEILLMFTRFGLVFPTCGLFVASSLLNILQLVPLILFLREIYFVIETQ
jgi:hypothetical protein